jgi:hypothetical protein
VIVVPSTAAHHRWRWTRPTARARAEDFTALNQIVDNSIDFWNL